MELNDEDVQEILALLDSLPYDELDLETPRFRLTLRRGPDGEWARSSKVLSAPNVLPAGEQPAAGPPGNVAAAENFSPDGKVSSEGKVSAEGNIRRRLVEVRAPLPGTFYRAPRPGAAPFVEVGSRVGEDTVVAIIETMKLMNSVHAGTTGRVARITVDNGEFAPLGTTLMLIEPAT